MKKTTVFLLIFFNVILLQVDNVSARSRRKKAKPVVLRKHRVEVGAGLFFAQGNAAAKGSLGYSANIDLFPANSANPLGLRLSVGQYNADSTDDKVYGGNLGLTWYECDIFFKDGETKSSYMFLGMGVANYMVNYQSSNNLGINEVIDGAMGFTLMGGIKMDITPQISIEPSVKQFFLNTKVKRTGNLDNARLSASEENIYLDTFLFKFLISIKL